MPPALNQKASLFRSITQLPSPVRTWCHANRLAKGAVEIRLRRKSGGAGDVDQQPIARQRQPFGEIEALAAEYSCGAVPVAGICG
jgi:hypothetical protein